MTFALIRRVATAGSCRGRIVGWECFQEGRWDHGGVTQPSRFKIAACLFTRGNLERTSLSFAARADHRRSRDDSRAAGASRGCHPRTVCPGGNEDWRLGATARGRPPRCRSDPPGEPATRRTTSLAVRRPLASGTRPPHEFAARILRSGKRPLLGACRAAGGPRGGTRARDACPIRW